MPTFNVVMGLLLSRAVLHRPRSKSRQAGSPRPDIHRPGSSASAGDGPAARRADARADRMGIVETNQPLAIRPMQCERVVDAVRLLRRPRHPCHDKAYPMATGWIEHEN